MNTEPMIPTIKLRDLWRFKVDGSVHLQRMHGGAEFHNWFIPLHRHSDLCQLFLITNGRGEVEIDGNRTTLEIPWLLWLPANTVHALRFSADIDGYILSISAEYLMGVVADEYRPIGQGKFFEVVRSHRVAPASPPLDSATTYLNSLSREFETETAEAGIAVESLIRLILISILRMSMEATDLPEIRSPESALFVRFRHLVEKHYRDHLPIGEYARKLCIAEQQLHAICKANVQIPPQIMLHERLILEAKREILYTSRTISQIAFDLGFEDPAYFSRFFTKREGISPAAYRQRLRSVALDSQSERSDLT